MNLPSERLRRLFFAGLGVVFVLAFLSLRVQIDGLIGSHGILPAADFLRAIGERSRGTPLEHAFAHGWPTLFWLDASDATLHLACGAGIACGLLLVLGVAPLVTTPACWLLYLSLANADQLFLNFQWDALLLEVALFATFLAPGGLLPWRGTPRPPTFASLWAMRLLLFRFLFSSGAEKLLGGDPTWRDATALTYHYWTQPLPTLLGWYAHQMPVSMHRFCCVSMFVVELGAPWLLFFGPLGRRLFAVATAGLMATIAATGNYGFFEPLTVVLCLPLLMEESEPTRWIDLSTLKRALTSASRLASSLAVATLGALALVNFLLPLSARPADLAWLRSIQAPLRDSLFRSELFRDTRDALEPWRSLNTYGLFVHMTRERPSLEIQGSDDQANWKSYGFRWKEGDLARPPCWCQPHMPRLDWQMWFAALDREPELWVRLLLFRLLQGEPAVLALFESNPFPDRPPRFVRVIRFEYEFTTLAERAATGHWWKRQETGVYLPPVGRR